jgi:poly(hydroxyalkanoate) depolymerase family esterase
MHRLALRSSCLLVVAAAACAPPQEEDAAARAESAQSTRVQAGTGLVEVTGFGANPGALKMFEHVPASLPVGGSPPLLVVLHGCTQRAADIAQAGWNELADANGFVVLYPEQQTSNSSVRCFSWAPAMGSPDDVIRGKGENASIRQMVEKTATTHGTDPKRTYVVGFSAGAAMAAVMAATWPDVFAGAATFAGLPYDCAKTFTEVSSCMNPGKDRTAEDWGARVQNAFASYDGPWPRMMIWQGTSDGTVAPKNQTQLARQWSNVHGLPEAPSGTDTVDGHDHAVWKNSAGNVVVETYAIRGMGHGVPVTPGTGCGRTGQYAFDKGICASRRVAAAFGLLTTD